MRTLAVVVALALGGCASFDAPPPKVDSGGYEEDGYEWGFHPNHVCQSVEWVQVRVQDIDEHCTLRRACVRGGPEKCVIYSYLSKWDAMREQATPGYPQSTYAHEMRHTKGWYHPYGTTR